MIWGRDDLALQDFDDAIRDNPRNLLAYVARSLLKERQGKKEEAIADFLAADKQRTLSPSDVERMAGNLFADALPPRRSAWRTWSPALELP